MREQVKVLREAARDPRVPIVVYPEGTRSRDGELLPFRRGVVDTLLRYRQWKVYLVTADGTLPCGRLKDMLNGVQMVDCRVNVSGPFDTPTDPKEFRFWPDAEGPRGATEPGRGLQPDPGDTRGGNVPSRGVQS